jgi:hypothetical protein
MSASVGKPAYGFFARLGDKWRATRSAIRRVLTKMRVVRWALISSAEALGTIREFVNSMKEQDAKIELLHVGESEPLIPGGGRWHHYASRIAERRTRSAQSLRQRGSSKPT